MSGEPIGGGVERGRQAAPAVALDLPGDPSAAARARRALDPLRPALGEPRFGDVRLMVSELVADEVRAHAGDRDRPLQLSASLDSDLLRVELIDDWTEPPQPDRRPEPGEPGWGVYLAQLLADRWGIDPASGGTAIWFEIQI